MRAGAGLLVLLLLLGCSQASPAPDFGWPAYRDAIPDEQTAVQIAVTVFHAQFPQLGDPAKIAPRLSAFRYRRSDLVHDPKGDAWFVEPSEAEKKAFERRCHGECVGGDLFTMALSAHDGRVLEFYLPQ